MPVHAPIAVLPGEIRVVACSYAPMGWATCDGALRPIAENEDLFKAIGTTYGGDGVQTFAAPDLRRTKVGQDGLRCVAVNYCISMLGMYPPRP